MLREIREIRKTARFAQPASRKRRVLPDRMHGPQRSGLQMKLLDALVEQRIAAAAARGEFEDLPGTGEPLTLDDVLVPEEVRVANRILKNAGFVPPAVEQLRALRDLQSELNAVSDQATRCRLQVRMLALDMALESLRGGPLVLPREYCRRIAERLSERVGGLEIAGAGPQ
jgi:DnaJ-like protein